MSISIYYNTSGVIMHHGGGDGQKPNRFDDLDGHLDHVAEQRRREDQSRQIQMERNDQEINLKHKQVYANDMFGRLYADLEKLMIAVGMKITPVYQKYSVSSDDDDNVKNLMFNIQGYLTTLEFYSKLSEKKGVCDHSFATEEGVFQKWNDTFFDFTRYTCTAEQQLPISVIRHILNCISQNKIIALDREMKKGIVSDYERTKLTHSFMDRGLNDGIRMHYQTDKVAALTKLQLENMKESDLQFSRDPFLKLTKDDLDYKTGTRGPQFHKY